MHYGALARPLGLFFLILAVSMLPALLLALFEPQTAYSTLSGFLLSLLASALLSGGLLWAGRGKHQQMHRKEGLLMVAIAWISAGLLGSIPFIVSGSIPGFINAFFESVSGFTTTGATVIADVESMPRSLLLWRALTNWFGGMGIVVLFIAVLPSLGIGGRYLYRSETSGPSKSGLTPRTTDTARLLWLIYLGFTVLLFGLLWGAGMPLFDAVCHALATLATGGYSTQNDSIAGYSPLIHIIITAFMLVGGVNFSLYYSFLRDRTSFIRDGEFRFYIFIFLLAVAAVFATLQLRGDGRPLDSLRETCFSVATCMTSCGFATADFEKWPPLATGILLVLMLFGGSAGSTSGGMKMVRVLVTLRLLWMSVIRSFRPQAVLSLRVGGEPLDDEIEYQILTFVMLYLVWCFIGIVILLGCGHDYETSISAVFACIGNAGPGIGLVGPMDNYSVLHPVAKVTLCLLMIVGRLELMAISVLFVPGFWKR